MNLYKNPKPSDFKPEKSHQNRIQDMQYLPPESSTNGWILVPVPKMMGRFGIQVSPALNLTMLGINSLDFWGVLTEFEWLMGGGISIHLKHVPPMVGH